jgi:hypothetical protein
MSLLGDLDTTDGTDGLWKFGQQKTQKSDPRV